MSALSSLFAFMSGTPALVGPMLTALIITLTSDWRVSLSALTIQYVLVGLALTQSIRIEAALVKVLVGVLVVLILFLSAQRIRHRRSGTPQTRTEREIEEEGPSFLGLHIGWLHGPLGFPMRVLAVLLVTLAIVRLFQSYSLTIVSMDVALVACWLGGMGMLGLVLSGDPVRVAAAVLTILTGFDLVYARLEPSLAVVGFFGAFSLLAALAFAYLTAVHCLHVSPPDSEEIVS